MGSANGARKAAATRVGLVWSEYEALVLAGQKRCTACSDWHPRAAFGPDRSRSDGLAASCIASRVRISNGPNKQARRDAKADGRSWCSGCSSWLPLSDVRLGKCKEHRNADYRARYARNGESIRQRVYARKRNLDPIPGWWVEEHYHRFDGMCAYGCGTPATSLDHIWPVAKGGKSMPGNLVPACGSCNSRKRDGKPYSWVERGFLAFPEQWNDLYGLSMEHASDDWFEAMV
jgi:5-methylcytosine-specific restriction endonuclease McrA